MQIDNLLYYNSHSDPLSKAHTGLRIRLTQSILVGARLGIAYHKHIASNKPSPVQPYLSISYLSRLAVLPGLCDSIDVDSTPADRVHLS